MSGFHGPCPLFLQCFFLPPRAAHLRLVDSAPSSCTFLVFDWNLLHLASNLSRTSIDKHMYRNQICILQNVSVGARVCEFRGYEEKAQKLNLVLGTDPSNMIDLCPLLFLTITQVVALHTIQSACNF